MTTSTTPKKPRAKKAVAAAAEPATPQILPRGSVAPVAAAPFTPPTPFVKKKPTWA
ncbi:MAG: hypothetical protein ACK45Y_06315 [Betaproteobacteria bacterium]|jgi:hypothetical protein